MVVMVLILFFYIFSSWYFAKRIDVNSRALWLLLLFSLVLFVVYALGVFNIFNEVTILISGLLLFSLVLFFHFKFPRPEIQLFRYSTVNFRNIVSSFLLILFFLIVSIFAYISPLFEIDSIAYHLPIVMQLIKSQGIWEVFHAGFVGPNTYFPANHEALQAFITVITGDNHFNFLVTLLSIYLFYFSLKDFARKKKINDSLIFLSVISIVFIPFLSKQLLNFQVDLFLFCLFGSLVTVLFNFIFSRNPRDAAKFFLLLGLVIGTKYNGIVQSVILVPLLLIVAIYCRKSLRAIWWLPFLTFLTGGIWYIRNWITTGNPIYPFGINLGFLNFEGHKNFLADMKNTSIIDGIAEMGLVNAFEKIFHNYYFENLIGKVSLLVILLTVFLIFSMIIYLLYKRKKTQSNILLIVFVSLVYLFVGQTVSYMMSPYTFLYWGATIRYSSAIFALIPLAFVLVSSYSKIGRIVVVFFTLFLFSYNFLFRSFLSDENYTTLLREKIFSFNLGKAQSYNDDFLLKEWLDYSNLLAHLRILRQQDLNQGNIIALAGITPYALFANEGLQPLYVNIDGCIKCKYPHYRNEKKSIRAFPNPQKWKEALHILKVNYLMIGRVYYKDSGQPLFEEKWAEEDSMSFKNLLTTKEFSLYQINQSAS